MSDTILLSEESPDTQLCMACLCVGRSLHEINQEKLKQYYLQALNEIQLCYNATCPLVCWECKAKLVKSVLFREQVKDSYRILQTYTRENLQECLVTDIIRQPQLRIQVLEPIALGKDDGTAQGDTKPELVYLKNEIKVEWDKDVTDALADNGNMSECSQDMSDDHDSRSHAQKLVVKKKIKKKKRVDRARKTSRVNKELKIEKNKNASKDQKILTIELSYEEMLQEREKDALKESYVKSEYRCELCLLGFSYSKSYKAHMAAKHDSALGDYSCPICKTILMSVESFTAHYKRHMRRFECTVCGKRTGDTKSMQAHLYTAHEVALRQYTCGHCGLVSNSIDSHRYHCDTHKARVQCSQCDKTFRHRAGLMNHRLAVHEFKNEFACSMCDKVFRWKTSLKRHLEKHDTKAKASSPAAYCVTCGVSFSSLCSYRRHLHTSLKHVSQSQLKFICDHCKKRFADKTKLRDHIEEKHLHKTFQCPVCMKPSKNRVGLDQHVRNVHKGRPNNKICHHCGKAFPTKVQLESHIRTHTGERPFICEYCPTTFSQQSNLYKHNRQVHLNIKSKRYPHCKKREIKNNTPQLELQTAQDFEVPVLRYSPERGFVM